MFCHANIIKTFFCAQDNTGLACVTEMQWHVSCLFLFTIICLSETRVKLLSRKLLCYYIWYVEAFKFLRSIFSIKVGRQLRRWMEKVFTKNSFRETNRTNYWILARKITQFLLRQLRGDALYYWLSLKEGLYKIHFYLGESEV